MATVESVPFADYLRAANAQYCRFEYPLPTLADNVGFILRTMQGIEATLDFHSTFFAKGNYERWLATLNDRRPISQLLRVTKEVAEVAAMNAEEMTWGLMDMEKLGRDVVASLTTKDSPMVSAAIQWANDAFALWRNPCVEASSAISRGDFNAAVNPVRTAFRRLKKDKDRRIRLDGLILNLKAEVLPVKKKSTAVTPAAGLSADTYERKMALAIFDDPQKAGFSDSDWAAFLNCSRSTIAALPFYKMLARKAILVPDDDCFWIDQERSDSGKRRKSTHKSKWHTHDD